MNILADALTPFTEKLTHGVVGWLILAGVVGIVARELRDWAERSVDRWAKAKRNPKAAPQPAAKHGAEAQSPHCPKCNAPMRQQRARRGDHRGEHFWGCSRYPDCRGLRKLQ